MTAASTRARARLWVLALAWVVCAPVAAQSAVDLRADFNTGPNASQVGGTGGQFSGAVSFGGRYLFTQRTAEHGTELWETDGTPQNTRLFFDLCPGVCDGFPIGPNFHIEGSTLYFTGNDGRTGVELWSLAAAASSPQLVADIEPGAGSSRPEAFRRVSFSAGGGAVARTFFTATRSDVGRELWRLASGSVQLEADLVAGPGSSNPGQVQLCSTSQICLLAVGPGGGTELRLLSYASSSGAPSGTSGVGGLNLGPNRRISEFVALGPNTYFVLSDFVQNLSELRVFGNSAASSQLLDSSGGSFAMGQLTFNAPLFRLFYVRGSQLKVTDGSPAGTLLLSSSSPEALISLGNRLLFTGLASGVGRELHVSDGTAAGTTLLKELVNGSQGVPAVVSGFSRLLSGNGTRVFMAFPNPALGGAARLWVSDGTAAGTLDISGSALSQPGFIRVMASSGTTVMFAHAPGNANINDGDPWFSSGLGVGTLPLGSFRAAVGDSQVRMVASFGDRAFVSAFDGSQRRNFEVDAADLSPPVPRPDMSDLIGERLGRFWHTGAQSVLMTRTAAGQSESLGLPAVTDALECYVERNGAVYFLATTDNNSFGDVEIARSDGTAAGTAVVTDLSQPGDRRVQNLCFSNRRLLAAVGSRLLFVARTASSEMELFALDANDAPSLVRDIRPGAESSGPGELVTLSGRAGLPDLVVFRADDGVFGQELWVSDGTGQGTQRLLDINPGPPASFPQDFVSDGRRVFFTAFSVSHGRELYVSDGTLAGTRRVIDLFAGPGNAFGDTSLHGVLAQANGRVYFSAVSSQQPGCALFESDGSEAGTRCAYDSAAQTLQAVGREAVALDGGALVFAAHRSAPVNDGRELRLLLNGQLLDLVGGDLAQGPASSNPFALRRVGGRVLFTARGAVGEELYRLQVPDFSRVFDNGFE
jgi:ELWxxDGT repeat protein